MTEGFTQKTRTQNTKGPFYVYVVILFFTHCKSARGPRPSTPGFVDRGRSPGDPSGGGGDDDVGQGDGRGEDVGMGWTWMSSERGIQVDHVFVSHVR